jgi:hypothetical protein
MADADLAVMRSDLAFLKGLAERGRGGPAPALLLMAAFGLIYGAMCLAMAAAGLGGREMVRSLGPAIWLAGHGAFFVCLVAFAVSAVTGWRRGVPVNRAAAAAWTAAAIAAVGLKVAFEVFARRAPDTYTVGYASHFAPVVLLTLWGAAWWVAASAADRPWARRVALGSWIAAAAAAWWANDGPIILVAGLSCLLLAFAPAVVLLRERRA